jgi:hypothetical protein
MQGACGYNCSCYLFNLIVTRDSYPNLRLLNRDSSVLYHKCCTFMHSSNVIFGYSRHSIFPVCSLCLGCGNSGQWQKIFPLASASGPAMGLTQLPVQCVPGALFPEVMRVRDVMLTTHSLLVPRLRKSRSYTFSAHKRFHVACSGTTLSLPTDCGGIIVVQFTYCVLTYCS